MICFVSFAWLALYDFLVALSCAFVFFFSVISHPPTTSLPPPNHQKYNGPCPKREVAWNEKKTRAGDDGPHLTSQARLHCAFAFASNSDYIYSTGTLMFFKIVITFKVITRSEFCADFYAKASPSLVSVISTRISLQSLQYRKIPLPLKIRK